MTSQVGFIDPLAAPPATPGSAPVPVARDAAGPGYAGEWALFCDYTTATGQPALPTTVDALTGFFTALPARPATLARRVRAIAAAHRRVGHLLERPDTGPAAPPPAPTMRPRWTEPGALIKACPTRGWPHGLHGRRDAFLIVLTVSLAHPYTVVRTRTPAEITVGTPPDEHADATTDHPLAIGNQAVPMDPNPRACPACAVVRWLDTLGTLDGLGRGSARMDLVAAHAPTPDSPHRHEPRVPERWRGAAVLLPAIDQHGWHDDYRPISTRTIRTRLAHAAARAARTAPEDHTPRQPPNEIADSAAPRPTGTNSGQPSHRIDDVLTILDGIADDADALNARIQALLDEQ